MNRNIICCLLTALVSLIGSERISAQDHCSARMNSLGGGHVSGIIPDFYTDLGINPAYAYFADSLTINYGHRNLSGFRMVFPYLTGQSSSSPLVYDYPTNELSFFGIRLSRWRAAVSAEWRIDQYETQDTHNEFNVSRQDYQQMHEYWNNRDTDFWKINLMAARPLGSSHVLGVRLKGSGNYESNSHSSLSLSDEYASESLLELASEDEDRGTSSVLGRQVSLDFRTGILRLSGAESQSEIILEVSADRINYDNQNYALQISKQYGPESQITQYDYEKGHWGDTRKGDLWTYRLWLRRTFRGGMRIFAGGCYSRASYDAAWDDFRDLLRWNLYSSHDDILSGKFSGEGSLRQETFFLKCGKIFSVHRNIDLYLGLHGEVAYEHAREAPIIHYTHTSESGALNVRIDQPSIMEVTNTSVNCYFPISIEFRPSSYFSYFAGFILYGQWYKHSIEWPLLAFFDYNEPQEELIPSWAMRSGASRNETVPSTVNTANWHRELVTGHIVTLGFSLHYGKRLFIDVYTGSDIVPQYLSGEVLDVRYSF